MQPDIQLLWISGGMWVFHIRQVPAAFVAAFSASKRLLANVGIQYLHSGEVCFMLSFTKLATTTLLVSALLCTLPLAAASKTRSSAPSVQARHTASRSNSKASSSGAKTSGAKTPSSHASSGSQASSRTAHSSPVSSVHRSGRHAKVQPAAPVKAKARGQQSIDQARALEIQQALIREHYLNGEATGEWDQATRDALIRFQGDHHWQTKIIPDSRALIMLGLGPSHQNLLNPESAAIAIPYQSGIERPAPGGAN